MTARPSELKAGAASDLDKALVSDGALGQTEWCRETISKSMTVMKHSHQKAQLGASQRRSQVAQVAPPCSGKTAEASSIHRPGRGGLPSNVTCRCA